jgi:predicted NACHT family NTPase
MPQPSTLHDHYLTGIQTLLGVLGRHHPRYEDALVLQHRLQETIEAIHSYGAIPETSADLARIIADLNRLSLTATDQTFYAHCGLEDRRPPLLDDAAIERYYQRVKQRYNTMRVLGKPAPVPLTGMYTDVYLLKEPVASRPSVSLPRLKRDEDRQDGLELVKRLGHQQLVILGKPGSGKTTFLKHIALQAGEGQLDDKVPVLVFLREWAGDELLDFLTGPFLGCGLAAPRACLEELLRTGRALLLFDGLDEVRKAERCELITRLERFRRRYLDCPMLVTCRGAATPYQFEQARYVEIADFSDAQMRAFARHWFADDARKCKDFFQELAQDAHLRDLGRTPLLLGMLCLTYDQQGTFPQQRAHLYRRALDALLVQWDEARNVARGAMRRAEVYHALSLGRKHRMSAAIAYETFEQGESLIAQERLEQRLLDYLVTVPDAPERIDMDARAVLKDRSAAWSR